MEFAPAGPLRGTAAVPGDKSISHRALILAAMAKGRSRIANPCNGEDVTATAAALRAMGMGISPTPDGGWAVDGVGTGCLLHPARTLDMGNSGTAARLLMGLVSTHPIEARFHGDASLTRRPMERVAAPLRRLGAEILCAPGGRLPLVVRGTSPALARDFTLDVASAQLKSALLLAGLNTPGATTVIEPIPTRDHSERMLKRFGAEIDVTSMPGGGRRITIAGEAELRPQVILVPGDPSAAAFLTVAALIVPGSTVHIPRICVSPLRTGLFTLLRRMGGDIAFINEREIGGEPIADLEVRHSALQGIEAPPELVPAMIDEFPIFFIAAAFAAGESRARGLAELRVKESDRISAMARGLRAIGVAIEEGADRLAISGSGGAPLPGGGVIASHFDHRVAMSFAVAGLHALKPVGIDDMSSVATSFPGFAALLARLSAA